ncbi:hypothetical protein BH10ACT7_BH10ACT7_10630 [soil metagenome]
MTPSYPEFIPQAGACLVTLNAYEGKAPVRWMVREKSKAPADNGWIIMSAADTTEYMNDTANWRITSFNEMCGIEPALISIYDMPVGSDLGLVRDETGIHIVDNISGREITSEYFYVPPQFRAES